MGGKGETQQGTPQLSTLVVLDVLQSKVICSEYAVGRQAKHPIEFAYEATIRDSDLNSNTVHIHDSSS